MTSIIFFIFLIVEVYDINIFFLIVKIYDINIY